MIIEIKNKGIDSYVVYNKEEKKNVYIISKKFLMGLKYIILKDGKKVADIKKSAYDLKRADITIGSTNMGYISCDWTNRLDVKLFNGWYISCEKDGYQIRSYGDIIANVNCKYNVSVKYEVKVANPNSLLCICATILALDIINYNEEKY
jgi:uncharacterized protein YxjI